MNKNDMNKPINMKNLLWKYPIIYLFLFCVGGLLSGFEIGRAIKNGLPDENIEYYLRISSICANLFFGLYFFYCYIKIKKKKAGK